MPLEQYDREQRERPPLQLKGAHAGCFGSLGPSGCVTCFPRRRASHTVCRVYGPWGRFVAVASPDLSPSPSPIEFAVMMPSGCLPDPAPAAGPSSPSSSSSLPLKAPKRSLHICGSQSLSGIRARDHLKGISDHATIS